MSLYQLDTNICIYVMNQRPASVRLHMDHMSPGSLYISTVTQHELMYGALNSQRPSENIERLTAFLEAMSIYTFDSDAAEQSARIRQILKSTGKLIGGLDLLIAGHALSLDATLVTNNTREFERVPDLKLENWA